MAGICSAIIQAAATAHFASYFKRKNARNRAILEGIREPFSDLQTSWRRGRDANPDTLSGISVFKLRRFAGVSGAGAATELPSVAGENPEHAWRRTHVRDLL